MLEIQSLVNIGKVRYDWSQHKNIICTSLFWQEQVFEGISILCRHAKSVANVNESSLKRYPTDHLRHTSMSLNKNDLSFSSLISDLLNQNIFDNPVFLLFSGKTACIGQVEGVFYIKI